MGTVRLMRTSEYVNLAREYGIYVDNKKIGTIRNGQTENFEIEPGTHTIYAKIDWCYSPARSFTLNQADNISFKVGAFKHANWIILFFTGIIVVNLIVNATLRFDYLKYLLWSGLSGMIYILSFGRKKYLTLTQEPE